MLNVKLGKRFSKVLLMRDEEKTLYNIDAKKLTLGNILILH
jgi:hypothetical protein